MSNPVITSDNAVQLSHIDKRFGSTHAVRDVSLDVRRGTTVALLGPNGAGKTTTINLLLGVLQPDAGSVRILGDSPRSAIAAGRVGAMLQDGGLLPGARVVELLHMLAAQYAAPLPVEDVLRITQLDGLERRRVDRLSGGQLQRLRAGLALIGNPELLVLDEPTAAMDVEARRTFWSTMRRVADSGCTILFSTHYLEEADAFADRIVLMAHGQIVADGTPAQIKASLGSRVVAFSTRMHMAWDALPSVTQVQRHGDRVELHSSNSDVTLRAVLERCADAHDVEVHGAALEDAFIALTAAAPAA